MLRGINLGPRNRVSMARLREVCAAAGGENVRTLIASGNVVLDSALAPAVLRRRIEAAIETEFGFKSAVVVLSARELARIIRRSPFADADPASVHVGFATGDFERRTVQAFESLPASSGEQAAVDGRQIYFRLPHGFGRATLPGLALTKVQPPVTIRSWKTVLKLSDLAAK